MPGEKVLVEVAKDRSKDIYDDGLRPAVKEISKSLQTVFGLVNTLLYPLDELRKNAEYKHQHFMNDMRERAKAIPEGKLITPPLYITGPAFEGLRYTMDVKELRDMYIKLIASAMNSDTADDAHPSYAEVIKQLSPDEARIIKAMPHFGFYVPVLDVDLVLPGKGGKIKRYSSASAVGRGARCRNAKNAPAYINNLCRLGLAETPDCALADESGYDRIYASSEYRELKERIPKEYQIEARKVCFGLTAYGAKFRSVCMGVE